MRYKIINNEAKCQSASIRHSYCPIDMRVFGSGKCGIRARNGGVSQLQSSYRSHNALCISLSVSHSIGRGRTRLHRCQPSDLRVLDMSDALEGLQGHLRDFQFSALVYFAR